MDNYVLVAGNGNTSRANLEALMEDYFYSKKSKNVLVLAFDKRPSQGQMFAAQLAKDKDIDIIAINTVDDAPGLPSCSVNQSDDPIKFAIETLSPDKDSVFLLWDDEDKDCLNALAYAKEAGITCLDLTDGLNALTASEGIKADKPIAVPEAEESPEEEYETEEEDEADETDESDEEDELYEEVYLGLEAIAKLIATAVVAELNASKKAKKAPRK